MFKRVAEDSSSILHFSVEFIQHMVDCLLVASRQPTTNQNQAMKITRSNIMDSRSFQINGTPVICYRNKFGGAPIAWMIKTQGEWSTWPMAKHTIRRILQSI